MEQFNTPSTFAKYSKMQRDLIKIDKQVTVLTSAQAEQEQAGREKHEKEQE